MADKKISQLPAATQGNLSDESLVAVVIGSTTYKGTLAQIKTWFGLASVATSGSYSDLSDLPAPPDPPESITLNPLAPTPASGANAAGETLHVQGGKSTGTGMPGGISFETAVPSSTSGSGVNGVAQRALLQPTGSMVFRKPPAEVVGVGTITVSSNNGGRTIYGTGTKFTEQLAPGALVRVYPGAPTYQCGIVQKVISDTEVLCTNAPVQVVNQAWTFTPSIFACEGEDYASFVLGWDGGFSVGGVNPGSHSIFFGRPVEFRVPSSPYEGFFSGQMGNGSVGLTFEGSSGHTLQFGSQVNQWFSAGNENGTWGVRRADYPTYAPGELYLGIDWTTGITALRGLKLRKKTNTGTLRDAASVDVEWTDATDATRTSKLGFTVIHQGVERTPVAVTPNGLLLGADHPYRRLTIWSPTQSIGLVQDGYGGLEIDGGGRVRLLGQSKGVVMAVPGSPSDIVLYPGEIAPYLDETSGAPKLKYRVRLSNGSYGTAELPLTLDT